MFWLNLLPGVVIFCAIVGIPLRLTLASWHVELTARTALTELRARKALAQLGPLTELAARTELAA
jgi:hypothetical protein